MKLKIKVFYNIKQKKKNSLNRILKFYACYNNLFPFKVYNFYPFP